jgi:hypothetical protein
MCKGIYSEKLQKTEDVSGDSSKENQKVPMPVKNVLSKIGSKGT